MPALVTRLDAARDAETPAAPDGGTEVPNIPMVRPETTNFDVCATITVRYRDLPWLLGIQVLKAVDQTWGLVLRRKAKICDTRFLKMLRRCDGAILDLLGRSGLSLPATACGHVAGRTGAGSHDGAAARSWILSKPESFCNTEDAGILSQVRNDYDLETRDFFRWSVPTDVRNSELIRKRSGFDFGTIQALIPVERGPSGRLKRLEAIGTKLRMVIGN